MSVADKKGTTMIDWSRLHDLCTDIGEEEFADLVLVFVTEMGERLTELAASPASTTAEDFHFLRGSAANLGLSDMVTACHAGEAACRAGTMPDIAAVADAFGAAIAAIQAKMPEIASAA